MHAQASPAGQRRAFSQTEFQYLRNRNFLEGRLKQPLRSSSGSRTLMASWCPNWLKRCSAPADRYWKGVTDPSRGVEGCKTFTPRLIVTMTLIKGTFCTFQTIRGRGFSGTFKRITPLE